MNCLQNLSRTFSLPAKPQLRKGHETRSPSFFLPRVPKEGNGLHLRQNLIVKAGGKMDNADIKDEKSNVYSDTMTQAMGAVLTYKHELGMNYNFILPDLVVGSCLQAPEDVDKLRKIGVKTVFCLQQDPDLEYFGVDINAIREYAQTCDDIEHIREEIRDFDKHDLRMRLPAAVAELYKAINRNGGVTYIHCTAGLGRAPAVALLRVGALHPSCPSVTSLKPGGLISHILLVFRGKGMLAYMYWVQGYRLNEALQLLQSKRPCFPKMDAIKSATADILTGLKKKQITLQWAGNNCSAVEISGLDIGWGQKIPLNFHNSKGVWFHERELPEGVYEYKYVVDGEWLCNDNEPRTSPSDGNVNNYVKVIADDPESDNAKLRKRLTGEDPDLREEERSIIKDYLERIAEGK